MKKLIVATLAVLASVRLAEAQDITTRCHSIGGINNNYECNSTEDNSTDYLRNSMSDFGSSLGELFRRRARVGDIASDKRAELMNEIRVFAADPKHPYYGLVRVRMAELLRSGQATNLADAYEQAVRSSPAVKAIQEAHAEP